MAKRYVQKKMFFIITILLMHGYLLYSQHDNDNNFDKNTFYIEVGSKGPLYSLNYDHIFHHGNKLFCSFRIGFSIEQNAISLPLGINFITGKENHHAEFGLTLIPYLERYETFLSGEDLSDKSLFVIPAIGYRFQRPSGGFFFKASVSPLIFLDPPSDHFWNMQPKVYAYSNIGIGLSF